MDPGDVDDETLAFAHGLFELARAGGADPLGAYLDAGLTPDRTNDNGDTLLLLSAYHGHEETVRVLLARDADHGRVNDKGQTALGSAVSRQDRGVVRALLAAGADPDGGGRTARDIAQFFDLPGMLALLGSGRPGAEPAG